MTLNLTTATSGIPYEWLPAYNENFTHSDSDSVAHCIVLDTPDFRMHFPIDMMGDAIPGISRKLPQTHPHKTWMYCVECKLMDGKGAWRTSSVGAIEFFANYPNQPTQGYLIYEVTYRPVPYTVLPDTAITSELDRYVVRKWNISIETYQMPGNTFGWSDEGTIVPIPENIAKQRPFIELHYSWHWVPEPIKMSVIVDTVGKINQNPFDNTPGPANKGHDTAFKAGHLLCAPPEISDRMYTPSGQAVRDINYVFLFRPDSTWNDFFQKQKGDFVRVYKIHNGAVAVPSSSVYEEADFAKLFQ